MKKQLLYRDLAKYYDLIYSWKDYKREAEKIKRLISKYKKSKGKELLDIACGTGAHLRYFKNDFHCMGVDINEGILVIARKNIKGVKFREMDMIKLNLNKQFDVITCLFSSVGYVKTYSNLKRTIKNFAKHLKIGGVVIIELWFSKRIYRVGLPHMNIYDGENIKIARLNISKRKGNISCLDMHYLIAEKDKDVKHFVERHELGMFKGNKVLDFMKKAGLKAKYLKNGLMKDRGLYLGVKVSE